MNKLTVIILLIISPIMGYCFSNDTIRLNHTDILEYRDTVFFGIRDSIVILPQGVKYKVVRNRLALAKEFNKDKKTGEAADYLYNQYLMLLKSQMVTQKYDWDFNYADSNFIPFENKIIRNIKYISVDILEGNVYDTTKHAISDFGKLLNKTHIKTRRWVIERNLKFKKNDIITPRIISDNERLIRGLPYIEEVRIVLKPTSIYNDSVDIFIITKDNFPIGVKFEPENYNKFSSELYTVNFLGVGNELGGLYQYAGDENQKNGYGANYKINNIFGTFTNIGFKALRTYETELIRTNLSKPFLTTDTKLGGDFTIEDNYTSNKVTINSIDSSYNRTDTIRYQSLDSWGGISLFPYKDLNKIYINIAARYNKKNFLLNPYVDSDSNYMYHDFENYFTSLTAKKETYIKTSKLLSFGSTEDIAIGRSIQFIGGLSNSYYYKRTYFGSRIETAFLTKRAGLFSFKIAGGSFINNGNAEDVIIGGRFIYFSPLIELGSLKLRNVFSSSYTGLINPRYHTELNFGNKIRELDQVGIYGNSNVVIRYQPIFFTHFYWIGFKFSFNPFTDIGWISSSQFLEGEKNIYSVYGINFSLKNESFTIPALSLQLGYYPENNISPASYLIKLTLSNFRLYNLFSSFKPEVITSNDFN